MNSDIHALHELLGLYETARRDFMADLLGETFALWSSPSGERERRVFGELLAVADALRAEEVRT